MRGRKTCKLPDQFFKRRCVKTRTRSRSNPCWQASTCGTKGMQMPNRFTNKFRTLRRINLKDWEGLALKGRILLDRGQTAEAIPPLQQSHKIHPEAPEPAFDLARAYIAQGKLKEAQSPLQDVMKVAPKFPGALILLAALNLEGGHVDQALQNLKEDEAREPASIQRSFLLSQAYAAKGDYHSAESQLQSLLGGPGSPGQKSVILQSLASIKLAQKQFTEAANVASAALDASPRLPTALYVLGMSYVEQKQPDKGIEALKSGLGDTYWLNKQPELARRQFEKVAQQESGRSYAMARLGQIYEAEGDFGNARVSYEKALTADPDNVVAKNNLAWVYAEHGGNLDTALKLAEEAKEKAPDDPMVTDTLGWIYVKKGSYGAAVENLQSSVAKNPHDPNSLYHLGTAYYKLGRTADAKRELEAALKMPNFSQAADAKRMLAELPPK